MGLSRAFWRFGWGAEEERLLQGCWRPQPEAQEEASSACPQGRQPIYEGAMRLQGQASFQDCARSAHEEAQGDGQLNLAIGATLYTFEAYSVSVDCCGPSHSVDV